GAGGAVGAADRTPVTAPPTAPPAPMAMPTRPARPAAPSASPDGRHDAVRTPPDADHTPPQAHPLPSGRRRARGDAAPQPGHGPAGPTTAGAGVRPADTGAVSVDPNGWASAGQTAPGLPVPGQSPGPASNGQGTPTTSGFGMMPGPPGWPDEPGPSGDTGSVPIAPAAPAEPAVPHPQPTARQPLPPAQPLPEEAPALPDSTQGRAISVRTLGQGVPLAQHLSQQPNTVQHPPQSLGSGRRRRLGTPPDGDERADSNAMPQPGIPGRPQPQGQAAPHGHVPVQAPGTAQSQPQAGAPSQGGSRLPAAHQEGRSYAIGAPDEGAEGPEPLDGPGGAVEVANRPQPRPVDDELPPEPLDNPRRLLVWPAPDVSTQQALSDRGYRPVIVHSREEVDAQIAAFPAALFVDPLTGPITRTALQSLRQAAVAAEVPVMVTAGLGQATREAAYGADPAVLLKALAPRDSEQHPSRVLLIEEHEEIALALTATLERRGMQVARAANDNEAVILASQMRPNLVVMDLMRVRRQRAGIIDWLRANGQLNRTPLVVYTAVGIDRAELPRLASGESVLFLAERSTSDEVQTRIVELLAKIGTN
ncbi:PAS domain S-box protein, partial [Streptomyces sp. AK02-01A]|nr:PAS domain S-box protein [Streptomyces sp. AK02-01A]